MQLLVSFLIHGNIKKHSLNCFSNSSASSIQTKNTLHRFNTCYTLNYQRKHLTKSCISSQTIGLSMACFFQIKYPLHSLPTLFSVFSAPLTSIFPLKYTSFISYTLYQLSMGLFLLFLKLLLYFLMSETFSLGNKKLRNSRLFTYITLIYNLTIHE